MPKTFYITLAFVLSVSYSWAQCTNPPPQPGSIIGFDPVCAGSTQTYYIYPVPGADDYTWVLPSGWTGTSTNTSITVTAGTAGGWIYVYANNPCGTSTAQGYLAEVMVANVTANTSASFCPGGSVVLNAMDNTGTGIYYQWYKDGVQITGATNTTYVASATGNYHVTIASNSCLATSGPMTVTVNPNPAAPTATNSSPTCIGTMLNFTGACSTPGVTYSWTGPNNFSNTQNPVIADTYPADGGTYTLTVTTGAGCSASATTTVVTEEIPAAPAIIAGPDHICAGESTTYSVANDVTATQYNWSIPNSWTGASTTNSIAVTAGSAGGTVSVSAENACGASTGASLNVIINPQPNPIVVQSGNTLSTTTTFSTYQWYLGQSPIAGATNQSFTPTQSGSYFVFVLNSYGCSAQSPAFTYTPVSVNNVTAETSLQLYPSPNNGNFMVSGLGTFEGSVLVQVADITGRIIHAEEKALSSGVIKVSMDSSLPAGVYTLRLVSEKKAVSVPFVKE